MDFFDSLIEKTLKEISDFSSEEYAYSEKDSWQDIGVNQVILQRDTLCELDGVGFNLVTSKPVKDKITVIGPDLQKIKSNCSFARVSVIEIDSEEDEQAAYNLIRKIEYTKYHTFPEGYMIRTSSKGSKEVVRVAKSACKNKISFQKVGSLFIKKYKENPAVKGVNIIFITDPKADFGYFEKAAEKNHDITETLNHAINNLNFDCNTCKLKPVCDEVEGMKELHFKTKMGKQ
ncbi:MAG: hypothetical protein IJ262_02795 [Clostridia bacterium]|nr:hypothetical protein [Clostridia bacterium]